MRAIVTVIGEDRIGIIADVSSILSKERINIVDVSQTILGQSFTMMMQVEIQTKEQFMNLSKLFKEKEEELMLKIKVYNERIFSEMHSL